MTRYYRSKNASRRQESKIPVDDYMRNMQQLRKLSKSYAERSALHSVWQINAEFNKMKKLNKRLKMCAKAKWPASWKQERNNGKKLRKLKSSKID